ncbi:MAG: hypothetical protein IJY35_12415 [Clostridia bacterium]|nr:hypothetical protein [Clostridia bacterium]
MKAKVPETQKRTVKVEIPGIAGRHQVRILNPASGGTKGGKAYEAAKIAVENSGGEIRISEKPGGIEELTAELFAKEPFAHAIVYGGDGTVNEAANGIMKSGNSRTASFSVIPLGSGNDFSRYTNDSDAFKKADLNKIDVIKTTSGGNVRYCMNVMNVGFDCDVVCETYSLKKIPIFRGSMAYIAGVLKVLLKKKVIDAKVSLFDCAGVNPEECEKLTNDLVLEQKVLLTAGANSRYYGGGFYAAPLADLSDGLMDILVVNDVSIPKFLSLVGAYHDGNYIDENGVVSEKFTNVISYRRCRAMEIVGPTRYCLDGEILETGEDRTLRAEVIPGALWFAAL